MENDKQSRKTQKTDLLPVCYKVTFVIIFTFDFNSHAEGGAVASSDLLKNLFEIIVHRLRIFSNYSYGNDFLPVLFLHFCVFKNVRVFYTEMIILGVQFGR